MYLLYSGKWYSNAVMMFCQTTTNIQSVRLKLRSIWAIFRILHALHFDCTLLIWPWVIMSQLTPAWPAGQNTLRNPRRSSPCPASAFYGCCYRVHLILYWWHEGRATSQYCVLPPSNVGTAISYCAPLYVDVSSFMRKKNASILHVSLDHRMYV